MVIRQSEYEAGDTLFYKSGNGSLEDTIISDWTNSPYVHVAIAVSAVDMIEALSGGVRQAALRSPHALWSYQGNVRDGNLQRGIDWLLSQVGCPYGFLDVLDAVVEKVESSVSLVGEHYDCSALATEFLIQCGNVPQLLNVTNPHAITPAHLAKLLNPKALL